MVHLPATEENPENTGNDSGNTGGNSGDSGNTTTTTYSVTLTVESSTSNSGIVADVTLTDKSDSTNVITGSSSSGTGIATLTGVKPGIYEVSVTKSGWTAQATIPDVTVTDADVTVNDAILMTQD